MAIVDEAVRCVLDEGFAAASAKHIAERAGVSWGVIQYHFGDRNGLLAEVVAYGYDNFRVAIEAVGAAESDPDRRVAAVVDAAWSAFSAPESRASLEILIATRSTRDVAQATELEEMARDMRRLGAVLVGDGPGDESLGRVIGEVMWAALRGLVLAQMITRQALDSSEERAILIDLIHSYLNHAGAG
jgi:TetR/AcrR family transcriptional regulator, regulator of cefoperazone and chloramphenicol sensitivity